MPVTEALTCAKCGHTEDQHDPRLGFCEAAHCSCMVFRLEDDFADDDEGELDFDQL